MVDRHRDFPSGQKVPGRREKASLAWPRLLKVNHQMSKHIHGLTLLKHPVTKSSEKKQIKLRHAVQTCNNVGRQILHQPARILLQSASLNEPCRWSHCIHHLQICNEWIIRHADSRSRMSSFADPHTTPWLLRTRSESSFTRLPSGLSVSATAKAKNLQRLAGYGWATNVQLHPCCRLYPTSLMWGLLQAQWRDSPQHTKFPKKRVRFR